MEPRLRKAYVVGAALGLTAGALLAWFVLRPILDALHPVDEEERPPVVVSNGSVKFEVPDVSRDPSSKPIPANKKGQFRSVTGATVYRHTGNNEANDASVNTLELYFHGATGCASYFTKELTITTTMGQIVVNLKQRGSSGKYDMHVTFPANAVKPQNHRLELGDHKLVSVKFFPILSDPGTAEEKTCTFDPPEANQWLQIWAR